MKLNALLISILSISALAKEVPTFSCSGTEPFWGINHKDGVTILDQMGEESVLEVTAVENFSGQSQAAGFVVRMKLLSGGKTLTFNAVRAAGCSDGMSEREYDAYATVDFGGEHTYFGCCKLPRKKGPLFQVTNVKEKDSLNVRKGPGTQFPPLDSLQYDSKNLEQVRCVKKWCFIRYQKDERTVAGWVHSHFLKRSE